MYEIIRSLVGCACVGLLLGFSVATAWGMATKRPRKPKCLTEVASIMTYAAVFVWALYPRDMYAADWPDEMPPPKWSEQAWQAAAESILHRPGCIQCAQMYRQGDALVCITPSQWARTHGVETAQIVPAVVLYGCDE